MRFRNTLISAAVVAALGTGVPLGVLAQSAPQAGQTQGSAPYAPLEEVVVTGIKASSFYVVPILVCGTTCAARIALNRPYNH